MLPSREKVIEMRLRTGNVGGSTGILPEMVRTGCSDEEFCSHLADLDYLARAESTFRLA